MFTFWNRIGAPDRWRKRCRFNTVNRERSHKRLVRERTASHLSFSGDSTYFSQLSYSCVCASFMQPFMTKVLTKYGLCANQWSPLHDDSVKTTSVENVSTGVLDKNKEHYLRCKDKAKSSMMYWDIHNCIHQNAKKKIYSPLCQTYNATIV